jgi:AGZA family xanthine/uracil permease-like MFS transporter
VEEGGRTGLTSVAVCVLFLLALFFTPVLLAIPAAATAPALVIVGMFMLQGIKDIAWEDFPTAVSAGLTILAMPLTFSISEGIAVGFVVHALLMLGLGRGREITWLAYVLAALFAVHFVLR